MLVDVPLLIAPDELTILYKLVLLKDVYLTLLDCVFFLAPVFTLYTVNPPPATAMAHITAITFLLNIFFKIPDFTIPDFTLTFCFVSLSFLIFKSTLIALLHLSII